MSSGLCITSAVLFLPCILWNEVSAQCSDPLIYRLDDIHHLIANLTANVTHCTTRIDKQAEQFKSTIDDLKDTLEVMNSTIRSQAETIAEQGATLSGTKNGKIYGTKKTRP